MVVLDPKTLPDRPWRNAVFCLVFLLTVIELSIFSVGVIRDDTLRYDRFVFQNTLRNELIEDYGLHARDLTGAPPLVRNVIRDNGLSWRCGSDYEKYFIKKRRPAEGRGFERNRRRCASDWKFLDARLHPGPIEQRAWFGLATHIFLHGGLIHLYINMLGLSYVGPKSLRRMGTLRFLGFFFICGVSGGALFSVAETFAENISIAGERDIPMIGASGAIFGLLGANLCEGYHRYRRTKPEFRSKLTKQALDDSTRNQIGWNLAFVVLGSFIAGAAHLGGLVAGFLLAPLFWRRAARRSV